MNKAPVVILQQIITIVEGGPNFSIELDLKDALEKLLYEDDLQAVSETIAKDFYVLTSIGIEPKSLISLMDARGLLANFDEILRLDLELDPIIEKIITEFGEESFHDELLESAKKWRLINKVDNFNLLRKYLSESEIADVFFGRHESVEVGCVNESEYGKIRDELADIAIKENRLGEFIYFDSTFDRRSLKEILAYFQSLLDKGVERRTILNEILWGGQYECFSEKWLKKLNENGLSLNLIPDLVIDYLTQKNHYYFSEASDYEPIGLSKFIESLEKEDQKKLFDGIGVEAVEDLYFYGEHDAETRKRISRFYLLNAQKIEGEMPLIYMEEIPAEELTSHERSKEFKAYLERVANGKDLSIDEPSRKDYAESATCLLAYFG